MAWILIIYDQLLIIVVAFVCLDLNYLIDQKISIDQRNFGWSDYQTFWDICSIISHTLPQRSAFSIITNFSTTCDIADCPTYYFTGSSSRVHFIF